MAEEKSLRHKVADRLAETVRNAGYNNPYGGRVYLSRREGRKFYAISFSYLNSVQGVINVYDTNFIQIEYRSGNMVDNPVFEAEKDARAFFKTGIVQKLWEKASKVPRRGPKEDSLEKQ
jgi:hypothetical protein